MKGRPSDSFGLDCDRDRDRDRDYSSLPANSIR